MGAPIDDDAVLQWLASNLALEAMPIETAIRRWCGDYIDIANPSAVARVAKKWQADRNCRLVCVLRAALMRAEADLTDCHAGNSYLMTECERLRAVLREPTPESRPTTSIGRWMQRHPTIARIFWFSP